jgi:hypothetical protein
VALRPYIWAGGPIRFVDWLQRLVCNQIRSLGVRFGKRAVVGAVRVFEPTPDYVFSFIGKIN